MKKLIIIVLIIALINLCLIVFVGFKINCRIAPYNLPDTISNKLLIDSIQYNINRFDSNIYKINIHEETILKKVDALNNDSSVWLFKSLVTNDSILYGGN